MPEDNIQKTGQLTWRELQELNDKSTERDESVEALKNWGAVTKMSPRQATRLSSLSNLSYDDGVGEGYGESKYDKDITRPEQLQDINEFRAQQQSFGAQLANGTGKALVLTGTTFLDTFVGTAAGIVNLASKASNGEINSWSDALNAVVANPVSEELQKVNDWSEKALPNYYTKAEQESPWYERLFTGNFVGDHFVKNLGFFAGAYLSGRTTAGLMTKAMSLNESKKIFEGAVKAATGTEMDGTKAINAILKGDVQLTDDALATGLKDAARSLKNAQTTVKAVSSIAGAMGESRIEAISGSKDYFDQIKNALDTDLQNNIEHAEDSVYEEHPEWFTFVADRDNEGNITGYHRIAANTNVANAIQQKISDAREKYDNALSEATRQRIDYANTAFLMNMAIVSSDYAFQFGDAFVGGFGKARVAKNLVNLVDGKYKEMAGREIAKQIGNAILSPIAEGTQEMFQEGVQRAAKSYYGNKLNNYYGDVISPDGLDSANGYLATFLNALGDVYSNPEDWENFALGALTALVGMPGMVSTRNEDGTTSRRLQWQGEFYEGLRNAREVRQQASLDAKALNDLLADENKREMYYNLVRQVVNTDKQQRALISGDQKAYKDAEYDKLVSRALTYIETGRYQDLLDEIDKIYTVEDKDIDEIKSITTDKQTGESIFDGKTHKEILDAFAKQKEKLTRKVEHIKEVSDNINRIYGNTFSREGYNQMVSLATTIDDREERIKQVSGEVLDYFNNNIVAANRVGAERLKTLKDINELAVYINTELSQRISALDVEIENERKALEAIRNKERDSAGRYVKGGREAAREDYVTLETARKHIAEINDIIKNGDKPLGFSKQLYDLTDLLAEREALVINLNSLSSNPLEFEATLRDGIANSINTYNDKIINTRYDKVKGISDAAERMRAIKTEASTPEILAKFEERAKKDGDKDVEDTISEYRNIMNAFDKHQKVFNKYHDDEDTGPYIAVLNGLFVDAANEATTEEEYNNSVKQILDEVTSTKTFGDDTEDIVNTFKKEVEELKKSKAALDRGKEENKEKKERSVNKNIASTVNNLLKSKNLESDIKKLDRKKAIEILLDDTVGEFASMQDSTAEELSSYQTEDLQSIVEDGINAMKDAGIGSYEKAVADNNTKDDNDNISTVGSRKNSDVEDDTDDDTDGDDKPVGKNEVVVTSVGEEADTKENNQDSGTKPTMVEVKNLKEDSKFKDGNVDQPQSVNGGKEDAWSVNRVHAKYQIKPLQDREQRKAKEYKSRIREYLDLCKSQEFIDSGELSDMINRYREAGISLVFRFVSLRTDSKDAVNDENNNVFLAVEIQDGYNVKNGNPSSVLTLGINGAATKKMQILGVVSSSEENDNNLNNLIKNVIEQRKSILDGHGLNKNNINNFVFATSDYTTNVEMVFSGRMVKQNDVHDEIGNRPLLSIVPKDDSGNLKSLEGVAQLAIVRRVGNDITVGKDLGGEVVPLNEYRAQNKLISEDVADRAGTPWLRVKEADGRVYSKSIIIRMFDNSYEDDDSYYGKHIKSAIQKIVSAKNPAQVKKATHELLKYIWVPKGKAFRVDVDEKAFRRGNDFMVDMSDEDAVQQIYDGLKSVGYKFSFGNNDATIDQIVGSNIFLTDLAQIRNANASLLISRLDEDLNPVPSEIVAGMRATGAIHTGNTSFDSTRNYGPSITFGADKTVYRQRGYGKDKTFWIDEGGHFIEVEDDNLKFRIEFATAIENGQLKPIKDRFMPSGYKKRVKIYTMPDYNGNDRYMTEDHYLLTNEDVANLMKVIKQNDKNGKALKALKKVQDEFRGAESKEKVGKDGDNNVDSNEEQIIPAQEQEKPKGKPVNLPGIKPAKKQKSNTGDVNFEYFDKLEAFSRKVQVQRKFFEFRKRVQKTATEIFELLSNGATNSDIEKLNSVDINNPESIDEYIKYIEAKINCVVK